MPAGSVFFEEVGSSWSEIGESTYFWSSTKEKDDYAYYMMLGLDSDKAYLGYADVGYSRYSVRCIKD